MEQKDFLLRKDKDNEDLSRPVLSRKIRSKSAIFPDFSIFAEILWVSQISETDG
jgi:hypothetical protein